MLNTRLRLLLCGMLCSPALVSCSSGEDVLRAPPVEQQGQFSEEDKIAARALSIGNREAVANAGSPYARALLCRHGVGAVAARFRQTAGLSQEQIQAVEQAQAYFDGQLRTLAGAAGKSASEVGRDLEQTAEDNQDIAGNARIAIACLQRQQEAR